MIEKIILSGGCFWCTESAFIGVYGVLSSQPGYTGGDLENPTYEAVCSGRTGHYEAVELTFDPDKITFLQILEIFWQSIDPTDAGGQFADRGPQYQTAIFYSDARQRKLAEESKQLVQSIFPLPITTEILPAKQFYPAESYHHSYCKKKPQQYQAYASHHEPRLQQIWKNREALFSAFKQKERLTPLQYKVTHQEETESPFNNAYCDHKEEGLYVDIVTGAPLFSSKDKYDSGSGWPSFTRPVDLNQIEEFDDQQLGMHRIEVRAKNSQSHLGHVFPDGPPPTGLRYCINSAALDFIPKEKMVARGYGDYLNFI